MNNIKTVTFQNPTRFTVDITGVNLAGNCRNFKLSRIGHLPMVANFKSLLLAPTGEIEIDVQYGVFDLSQSRPEKNLSVIVSLDYQKGWEHKGLTSKVLFAAPEITSVKNYKSVKFLSISNELLSVDNNVQNLSVINSNATPPEDIQRFLNSQNTSPIVDKSFHTKQEGPACVREINKINIRPQEGFPFFERKNFSEDFYLSPKKTAVSLSSVRENQSVNIIYFNECGVDDLSNTGNFPNPWFYEVNNSGENNLERLAQKFYWNSEFWPNFNPLISERNNSDLPTSITLRSGIPSENLGFIENALLLNNSHDPNLPSSSGEFALKTSGAITGEEYVSFSGFASEWTSPYTSKTWTHLDVAHAETPVLCVNSNRVSGASTGNQYLTTAFPSSVVDAKGQQWNVIPTGKSDSLSLYGTEAPYELWKLYSSQSGNKLVSDNIPWQPWAVHPPYILSSLRSSFFNAQPKTTTITHSVPPEINYSAEQFYASPGSSQGSSPYVSSGQFSYTDLNGDSSTVQWETVFAQAFYPVSSSSIASGIKDSLVNCVSGQLLVNHTNLASLSLKIT